MTRDRVVIDTNVLISSLFLATSTPAQAVDTVIEGLRNALARGQRIELRGFGVFQVKQRKKGIGRNPKTGVEVKIPPGNTIRFKPGKELRNLL